MKKENKKKKENKQWKKEKQKKNKKRREKKKTESSLQHRSAIASSSWKNFPHPRIQNHSQKEKVKDIRHWLDGPLSPCLRPRAVTFTLIAAAPHISQADRCNRCHFIPDADMRGCQMCSRATHVPALVLWFGQVLPSYTHAAVITAEWHEMIREIMTQVDVRRRDFEGNGGMTILGTRV